MKQRDKKRVKELLDLYFEAAATLEQESELRLYFASGKVDDEFAKYSPLFGYFNEEITKAKKIAASRYWMKPRFLYSIPAVAAIALFTIIFWPQEQQTGGLRLVLDGLEIEDESAAVSMADDRLAKFNVMMDKIDTKAESLEKLNRVEKALSGFDEMTRKIK